MNPQEENEAPKPKRRWRGRTMAQCTCELCGKIFMAQLTKVSRGKYKYCSTTCFYQTRRKQDGIWFDGLWYTKDLNGYYTNVFKSKKLHREVYIKAYGEIPVNHIIHHIDHDKTNNDILNLKLIGWGKHTAYHQTGKKYPNIAKHRRRDEYGRFLQNQ